MFMRVFLFKSDDVFVLNIVNFWCFNVRIYKTLVTSALQIFLYFLRQKVIKIIDALGFIFYLCT